MDEPALPEPEAPKYQPLPQASRRGIGLCLSGGGYRATLFHLGGLRRLNELGILSRDDFRTVSSVSGGSIAAAHLGTALATRVAWPAPGPIPDEVWDREVRDPLRELTRHDIRTGAIAKRFWPWNWFRAATAVEAIATTYEKRLTTLRLRQLPERPGFVLCATDMAFGVNWIFTRDRMGDYLAGYMKPPEDFALARAVAASACFPPVFNPLPMRVPPGSLKGGKAPAGPARDSALADLRLTDGGDYDNMGLEPVWKNHAVVLVSDAGGLFTAQGDRGLFWRIPRYQGIQEAQALGLRKRWLIASFITGTLRGTYWGVGSAVSRYGRRAATRRPSRARSSRRSEPTWTSSPTLKRRCSKTMDTCWWTRPSSCHMPSLAMVDAPLRVPHPAWIPPGTDEALIREALRGSDKRKLFGR